MRHFGRMLSAATLAAVCSLPFLASSAMADPIPSGWKAQNMAPVGFLGLENRYAYKLEIGRAHV